MDNKPVTQPDEVPEDDPYTVVPVGEGCSHCNAGEHWDVVFRAGTPEECGLSTSYGDKEVADDVANLCNDAFAQGIAELRQQVAALTAERDALQVDNQCHIQHLQHGEEMYIAMRGRCAGVEVDLFRCQDEYEKLEAENATLKARAEQAEARCERLVRPILAVSIAEEAFRLLAQHVSQNEGFFCESSGTIDATVYWSEARSRVRAARAKEQNNG